MQINHLSQAVYTFIGNQLPPAIGYQCYNVFYLAEQLGLKEYDQSFVNLTAIDDGVEMDTVRDVFIEKVQRLAVECIEGHSIKIDPDAYATLQELIEILHFLELVQRLEDMDAVVGRLNSVGTPRQILVDVIGLLSPLEPYRALEIIEQVQETLILSLQALAQDRSREQTVSSDHLYMQEVKYFQSFVAGAECIGLTLYKEGYKRMEWPLLVSMTPTDLFAHFATVVKESPAQCALDFISLAIVCKDTYQMPLLHLQRILSEYLDSAEMVTKIHGIAVAILTDYQTAKQAMQQQSAENDS